MTQITALCGVVHCGMERNCAAAAHLPRTALFGIEVVVSWGSGNYLALLCHPQAFRVGFVGFHVKTALRRFTQYA